MALASDIRATKKTAQALYCLYDKEEKRKTNKFQEWKKDFNEADCTTYNFFVSHNKNEPESLSNPNYLVEKVGECTEARVSDRQRRPDRCMTNHYTTTNRGEKDRNP